MSQAAYRVRLVLEETCLEPREPWKKLDEEVLGVFDAPNGAAKDATQLFRDLIEGRKK